MLLHQHQVLERKVTSCLASIQTQSINYTRAVIIGMALFTAFLRYADIARVIARAFLRPFTEMRNEDIQ
jgi:hypothetical protein